MSNVRNPPSVTRCTVEVPVINHVLVDRLPSPRTSGKIGQSARVVPSLFVDISQRRTHRR